MSPGTVTAGLVLAAAERWVGTPYRHQGARCDVGCDCLGLVRGIWQDVYGNPAPEPGPYPPDWGQAGTDDRLMEAARALCGQERPAGEARPGDLLVFRWRRHIASGHLGILGPGGRFLHAYSGHGVVWSALVPPWQRRISGIFTFPDP